MSKPFVNKPKVQIDFRMVHLHHVLNTNPNWISCVPFLLFCYFYEFDEVLEVLELFELKQPLSPEQIRCLDPRG